MRGEVFRGALLVCATILFGNLSFALNPCDLGHTRWDAKLSKCLNCTICDTTRHLAVLRPCEVHRDTLCVHLSELSLPWPARSRIQRKHDIQRKKSSNSLTENDDDKILWRLSKTREEILKPWYPVEKVKLISNKNKINYDYDDYYNDYDGEERNEGDEVMNWDIQTTMLTLAASGCILFFVVVVSLTVYHTRQWKRLKRTLESDVQNISAKLKLMESGAERRDEPISPPEDHIYLNIHHCGKDPLLGLSRKGLNNVYTQDKLAS